MCIRDRVYDYKKAPGVNEMQYGAAKYAWDYYEFKPVLSSIWTEAYNVCLLYTSIIRRMILSGRKSPVMTGGAFRFARRGIDHH